MHKGIVSASEEIQLRAGNGSGRVVDVVDSVGQRGRRRRSSATPLATSSGHGCFYARRSILREGYDARQAQYSGSLPVLSRSQHSQRFEGQSIVKSCLDIELV